MIIPLDDKTRIHGTEHCWQLQILRNSGEWRPTKYFQTIDAALREAAQREIRRFPVTGITEAIDACNRVTQKYSRIFDDVGR